MNICEVKDGEIILADRVTNELRMLYKAKCDYDYQMSLVRDALLDAMEKNQIKSFSNDLITVSYKAASSRRTVDVEKLKKDGIYNDYVKQQAVKSQVVIRFKGE